MPFPTLAAAAAAILAASLATPEPADLGGRVLLEWPDGDFVRPALSPSGRRLAVSRVVLRPGGRGLEETTEILALDVGDAVPRRLLDADQAHALAAYATFATSLRWLDEERLAVELSDGDVGLTTLVFGFPSGDVLSEETHGDDPPCEDTEAARMAAGLLQRHPGWRGTRAEWDVRAAGRIGWIHDGMLHDALRGELVRFGESGPSPAWSPSPGLHASGFAAWGPRALALASSARGWELAVLEGGTARVVLGGPEGEPHRDLQLVHAGERAALLLVGVSHAHRNTHERILVRVDADARAGRATIGGGALSEIASDAAGRRVALTRFEEGRRALRVVELP